MTTNFTPGPWTFQETANGYEVAAGRYRICEVGASIQFSESQAIANALLIASAPELLEAVKAASSFLQTRLDGKLVALSELAAIEGKLCDAIRLAEGGQKNLFSLLEQTRLEIVKKSAAAKQKEIAELEDRLAKLKEGGGK